MLLLIRNYKTKDLYIRTCILFRMTNLAKPFDMFIVQCPDEYEDSGPETLNALRDLAELCKFYQIPVISHAAVDYIRTIGGSMKRNDHRISGLFADCDYQNYIDNFPYHLQSLLTSSDAEVRIMITGGRFDYVDDGNLAKIIKKAKLNPEEVENGNATDSKRDLVVVDGCVPVLAELIAQEIIQRGKTPRIYIDTNSSVGQLSNTSPDSVYVLDTERCCSSWRGNVYVCRRISRESVLPQIPKTVNQTPSVAHTTIPPEL